VRARLGRLRDRLRLFANVAGIDVSRSVAAIRGLPAYRANRVQFLAQARASSEEFELAPSWPCPGDRFMPGGVTSGHYFHQDLYVAQAIYEAAPRRHIDVGSRVDGFVAHVAAFRQVEVLDIRPIETTARNIAFRVADLTNLSHDYDGACDSVSCLHALEHVGLGRYGDAVDYYGFLRAWRALHRMLEPGGTMYFSVPVGLPQRVEFDAHRVFSMDYLTRRMFAGQFSIERVAFVDDEGELHTDVPLDEQAVATSFGCYYGCGIFTLRKN
jgi:SAM-dependent methyltransferase